MQKKTNMRGGIIDAPRHSSGGVDGIIDGVDAPINMEGGEIVITREAAKKSCKELSKINVDGNGAEIPCDLYDEIDEHVNSLEHGGKVVSQCDSCKNCQVSEEMKHHKDTFEKVKSGEIETLEEFGKSIVEDHESDNEKEYLWGGKIKSNPIKINTIDYKANYSDAKVYDTYKNLILPDNIILPIELMYIVSFDSLYSRYKGLGDIRVFLMDCDNDVPSAEMSGVSAGIKDFSKIKITLRLNFKHYEKYKKFKYSLGDEYSQFSREAILLHEIQHVLAAFHNYPYGISEDTARKRALARIEQGGREYKEEEIEDIVYYEYLSDSGELLARKAVKEWLKTKDISYIDPLDSLDIDDNTFEQGGLISEFEMPDSEVLRYGQKLKKEHPSVWASGGNISGNESFEKLLEVSSRGYWLKSEKDFYGRWQSFKARHQHNHRLAGIVANIKWASWGNIGKEGAKEVIEESRKYEKGGKVDSFAEKLRAKYSGIKTLFLYESGDSIVLDMIEIKKEDRKSGIGTSVMQEIVDYADSENKTVKLLPAIADDRHGTTSRSRLVNFYKRFGFVENKGKYKDFTIKSGAMYRTPKNKFEDGGIVTDKLIYKKISYQITIHTDNYDDIIHIDEEYDKAKKFYEGVSLYDIEERSRNRSDLSKSLQKRIYSYKFIGSLDSDIEDTPDDYTYDFNNTSYWEEIDVEYEYLDNDKIDAINKSSDEILREVQYHFNAYAGYKTIYLDDEEEKTLKLRIKDHSGKWKNKGNEDYFLSFVITNKNPTSSFYTHSSEGLRRDEEFVYSADDYTSDEIINIIEEKINELKNDSYSYEEGGIVNNSDEDEESIDTYFNLKTPYKTAELQENIDIILSDYSNKEDASLKVIDYLTGLGQLARDYLSELNIKTTEYDKFRSYLSKRHPIVRNKKLEEYKSYAKELEQELTNMRVDNIINMALEQDAEINDTILYSEISDNIDNILSKSDDIKKAINKVRDYLTTLGIVAKNYLYSINIFTSNPIVLDKYLEERYAIVYKPKEEEVIEPTDFDKNRQKLDEFFTPDWIAEIMVNLAYDNGYDGKGLVLEPSFGQGVFFDELKRRGVDSKNFTGFEIYEPNYKYTHLKYPFAKLYNTYFEYSFLKEKDFKSLQKFGEVKRASLNEKFKLIIGNPPYGDHGSPHAYYFDKWMQVRAEGFFLWLCGQVLDKEGVLVMILPSLWMHNGNKYNYQKEQIDKYMDLVDAYRLPNSIFEKTDIATDILVFKNKNRTK